MSNNEILGVLLLLASFLMALLYVYLMVSYAGNMFFISILLAPVMTVCLVEGLDRLIR
jgi:ABC-type bacteriocin/lantibiotic exporter with double-glycine peptidase domain